MSKLNELWNKFLNTKVGSWTMKHPGKTALILGIISYIHASDFKNLFRSPLDIEGFAIDFGLSMIGGPDILGCILAGLAVGYSWKVMKQNGGFWKKGKGGFVLGAISLVLVLTPAGDFMSILHMSTSQMLHFAYYSLTGQDDKINEMSAAQRGGEEIILKEGDYEIKATFNRKFTNAYGTEIIVSGTITNLTDETWDSGTIAIGIVDENGNPKKVQSYDEAPVLKAGVKEVEPNETVEFKTNKYPGILESDYDGLVDYKILGVKIWMDYEPNE